MGNPINDLPPLSHEELDLIEVLTDPVKFALHHFGWEAYQYQADALRDPWHRKVLRWGRRTGKSDMLSVFVLWFAFTHGKDPEDQSDKSRPSVCLIAAPYENQVKLIFKRIRELINKSPELKQSLKTSTKNPEYIEFKNGSAISGFTAGTKSGAGGASMRGQYADWIIVDEMDYMTDDDINAIFAIASDKNRPKNLPPIGLMISSTPTGRRGKFYEFCMNAQDNALEVKPGKYHGTSKNAIWTEYYYPSTWNPGWQEEAEANEHEWRVLLGDVGYTHEILAEFGVETVGVFNKNFIDRAKKAYEYTIKPKHKGVRVMGVDWDKYQATPTFCILEWCPDEKNSENEYGMFKVINRESVPAEEFTLDAAVEKIVEWNKNYQPEWIYVDRGYGEYQVERLHKMGKAAGDDQKNSAYKLHKRVVGVHFQENREVRDPGTGEIVKKPAKPWMVTQTVILLERDRLILNKNDDMMWKQLENYRVEKISVTGQPTYTSVNEHCVDALMLCALAIADNMPDYIKFITKFDPARKMAIAPPINTPSMTINRETGDINRDEGEKFLTKKIKEQNSQTWFKVDSFKDVERSRNLNPTVRQFLNNSPVPLRGTGGRKPPSRARF
jgi:hypothetical protein